MSIMNREKRAPWPHQGKAPWWWIELHDPTTGEWHEVRASECLPGVVAEADSYRKGGAA